MIDFGRGMIFPDRYGRDEFTAAEEARQDAEQAASERGLDVALFEKEAAWTPARALPCDLVDPDDFRLTNQ